MIATSQARCNAWPCTQVQVCARDKQGQSDAGMRRGGLRAGLALDRDARRADPLRYLDPALCWYCGEVDTRDHEATADALHSTWREGPCLSGAVHRAVLGVARKGPAGGGAGRSGRCRRTRRWSCGGLCVWPPHRCAPPGRRSNPSRLGVSRHSPHNQIRGFIAKHDWVTSFWTADLEGPVDDGVSLQQRVRVARDARTVTQPLPALFRSSLAIDFSQARRRLVRVWSGSHAEHEWITSLCFWISRVVIPSPRCLEGEGSHQACDSWL